jgi:hypothetical protein
MHGIDANRIVQSAVTTLSFPVKTPSMVLLDPLSSQEPYSPRAWYQTACIELESRNTAEMTSQPG